MELPKKIEPDNIREAVVEVRYSSDLPFEVLIGVLFNTLDESYTYTNIPPNTNPQPNPGPNPGDQINIRVGVSSLFYNDKITVRLSRNAFIFSCHTNKYIGWEKYRFEIDRILGLFLESTQIKKFTRVGVRYISEYPNVDLRDCMKFSFTFGLPNVESDTIAFHSEFSYHGTKVILNLNNKVPYNKQNPVTKRMEIVKTSIIDIDVIVDNLVIERLPDLIGVIEQSHQREKEIFFGMLKSEFLETLNPQY